MLHFRCARAILLVTIGVAAACSSPASPSTSIDNSAAIAILGLTTTVEPLTTTPQPGLLYRLMYQVHESRGKTGAALVMQHFELSNGFNTNGTFNPVPHVTAAGTITVESTLSIYPAGTPASHVTFSITYSDDSGHSGTASADADVTTIGTSL